jgi:hypothetical protein
MKFIQIRDQIINVKKIINITPSDLSSSIYVYLKGRSRHIIVDYSSIKTRDEDFDRILKELNS